MAKWLQLKFLGNENRDGNNPPQSGMLVDMFADPFDRWRFLQELLEGETHRQILWIK
jgi:hypothetical protein